MFASSFSVGVFPLRLAYPSFLQLSVPNLQDKETVLTICPNLESVAPPELLVLLFSGCQPFFAIFLKRSAMLVQACEVYHGTGSGGRVGTGR